MLANKTLATERTRNHAVLAPKSVGDRSTLVTAVTGDGVVVICHIWEPVVAEQLVQVGLAERQPGLDARLSNN